MSVVSLGMTVAINNLIVVYALKVSIRKSACSWYDWVEFVIAEQIGRLSNMVEQI